MKRGNDQTLKDAVSELLESYHLKEKVNEMRLKENWEKIFGKTIARYTQKISVRNKKLFLHISSASLRHELGYSQVKMIEKVNDFMGSKFIEEIILQ